MGPVPQSETQQEISVARVVPVTHAEGPGARFAVWVQGCSIRCPGCFNPQYWGTRGGTALTAKQLMQQVPYEGVEGITLLGGEPFEQAAALADFAELVQSRGLSVMAFTGYTLSQLRERVAAGDVGTSKLLEHTDLLIDGPYVSGETDDVRPWVGSRNQGFHTLTDRYSHLSEQWGEFRDRLEITVAPDGTTAVNGWASSQALEVLLDGLRRIPSGLQRQFLE